MTEKFVVFKEADGTISDPKRTTFDYAIGDMINTDFYSKKYKCIEHLEEDNKLVYIFKQGKSIFTYDW